MKTLLSLSLVVCAAFAQYPPGGYPPGGYPPGTYPPGTYPGQQGGIGIPRRSKSASTTQKTDDYQVIRGVVRSIDDKSMEVGADDERIVTLQINDKTKKPDKLIPGDKVEIDATQDDKGAFVATEIRKTGSGPPPVVVAAPTPSVDGSASAKADKPAPEPADDTRPTTVMATPAPSDPDDDSGPPTLKHGIPKPRKQQAASTPLRCRLRRRKWRKLRFQRSRRQSRQLRRFPLRLPPSPRMRMSSRKRERRRRIFWRACPITWFSSSLRGTSARAGKPTGKRKMWSRPK